MNFLKRAFSLVELMVTLVVVAVLTAALSPVITKKLKSKDITVASGGNKPTFQECSQTMKDKGCAFCGGNADECSLCITSCDSDEFVYTQDCICKPCVQKDEKCIECNAKNCTKCGIGYGLVPSNKTCEKCQAGQYSSGEIACKTCPENHICSGDEIAPVACEDDQWANEGSTECSPCSDILANCAKCNPRECLECRKGYKLKEKNGASTCVLTKGSEVFNSAGTFEFVVPEGVEEINALLVGGGGGGGGGAAAIAKTATFVTSGTGGSANNANNALYANSSGIITWTIPESVRGQNVKVDACGGGGGGGYRISDSNKCSTGGRGGIINNVSVPMPNQETIKIIIGGYGAAGNTAKGGCAYGGGGAGYKTGKRTPVCGAPSNVYWGSGGYETSEETQSLREGQGGYDPIFGSHGSGGGSGRANGSKVGGGGGTFGDWYNMVGGGGGGATLFWDTKLANVQAYVAPGGGGGSCSQWGGGGGGGGLGGGTGGSSSGSSGGAGKGSGTNIFGSGYCSGGGNGANGKNGAMRISYNEYTNGGSGGGAGAIARNKISVSEGQILTIIVGSGGSGGSAGNAGSAGGVSQIERNGEILVKTLGGTGGGGNSNGTTAGSAGTITNGLTSSAVNIDYTVVNSDTGVQSAYTFSNANGTTTTSATGGSGGKTVLYGAETHCEVGTGGALRTNATAATGYGGCAGGGGGAGATGGAGAQGFVKLIWGEEII